MTQHAHQQAADAYRTAQDTAATATAEWEAARQVETDKRAAMNAALAAAERARTALLAVALEPQPEYLTPTPTTEGTPNA